MTMEKIVIPPSAIRFPGPTNKVGEQMRMYIRKDLEATDALRKNFETEQIIAEALHMQHIGRPAPLPRPTYLAVAIRAIYDDLESWSKK
nr:MAG TPA: hypothetical protein [Caudoviricetes sp.]